MVNGRKESAKFDLSGKVAVIVGGTSGIGAAITVALADAGAAVVPTSRSKRSVVGAVQQYREKQPKRLVCPADVNDPASLERLRDCVLEVFGRVDILVNSAGTHGKKPTLEVGLPEWERILRTNLTGVFLASQLFAVPMLAQRWGRIINIASLGSFVGLHEVTAYCVSKAGVLSLTQCLGAEWAKSGVTVNAIVPGVFRTTLNRGVLQQNERLEQILLRTPMARLGDLEELGAAAVFLASDGSSFVTGQTLVVDGGYLAAGLTGNSVAHASVT
jgi:NAD(P)-dependent dehydrogenase (short-subunit alcohol dehydrogenase family)